LTRPALYFAQYEDYSSEWLKSMSIWRS